MASLSDKNSACQVAVLQSVEELASLAPVWNEILAHSRSNTIFLTWEWLHAWSNCFLGKNRRLFVLVVSKEGTVVGIAPWCIHSRHFWGAPLRRIEFLGAPEGGGDYLDVFSRRGTEKDVALAIYRHVMASTAVWDSLHLEDIPANSLFLLHFLNHLEADGKFVDIRAGSFCPIVQLPESGDLLLAQVSPNRREQYRRHRRTLMRDQAVEYRIARQDEVLPVVRQLRELHLTRWTNAGADLHFLDRFIAECAGKDWIQVDYLSAGERTIAGLVHLRYGETLAMYLMAVDHAYSKRISLGNIIVGLSMERALEDGLKVYDFLKGSESYKFHWSNEGRRALDLRIHRARAATALSVGVDCFKSIAKLIVR